MDSGLVIWIKYAQNQIFKKIRFGDIYGNSTTREMRKDKDKDKEALFNVAYFF